MGNDEDRIKWKIDPSGAFLTKSTFFKLANGVTKVGFSQVNWIWKFKIPKKVKIFLCGLGYKSLNTHERLPS